MGFASATDIILNKKAYCINQCDLKWEAEDLMINKFNAVPAREGDKIKCHLKSNKAYM